MYRRSFGVSVGGGGLRISLLSYIDPPLLLEEVKC